MGIKANSVARRAEFMPCARKVRCQLVCVALTGFGRHGGDDPAFDYLIQATTGVASLTVDVKRAGLAALPSSTIAVASDIPAQITLGGLPAGVAVQLDGQPAGSTVAVPAGRHQITLAESP